MKLKPGHWIGILGGFCLIVAASLLAVSVYQYGASPPGGWGSLLTGEISGVFGTALKPKDTCGPEFPPCPDDGFCVRERDPLSEAYCILPEEWDEEHFVRRLSKPHILLVVLDDLGYSDVGFRGGGWPPEGHEDLPGHKPHDPAPDHTPNIDALARDGVILDQFYVMPVCSPSRAALLTGRYPIRYGMQYSVIRPWATNGLATDEYLLPQALKEVGYDTAVIGKWHLGHETPYRPTNRGFDYYYGGPLRGTIDFYTHKIGEYEDWDGGGVRSWYKDGELYDEGRVGEGEGDKTYYSTKLLARDAISLIGEHASSGTEKPLFLYLAFNAVHKSAGRFQVPRRWISKIDKDLDDIVDNQKKREFSGMIRSADYWIGKVFEALEENGMDQDTLIIFLSDNGGHKQVSNNMPFRGYKADLWEGGIRVTAIVKWPGVTPSGITRTEPMHAVDWFPTINKLVGFDSPTSESLSTTLGIASGSSKPIGLSKPKSDDPSLTASTYDSDRHVDGVDIWPTILTGAEIDRNDILINVNKKEGAMVRVGRWKYICSWMAPPEDEPGAEGWWEEELYDLQTDEEEENNLVDERAHASRLAKLRTRLQTYKEHAAEEIYQPKPGKKVKEYSGWCE